MLPLFTMAQNNSKSKKNDTAKINLNFIIENDWQPSISDAIRLTVNPDNDDTTKLDKKIEYTIINKTVAAPYKIKPIIPVTIGKLPVPKLQKGMVRIMGGTLKSFLADANYHSEYNRDKSWGIILNHNSMQGNIYDDVKSGFSNNSCLLYGKKMTSKHTFSANVTYNRDAFHYYGFLPNEFNLSKADIQQVYNRAALSFLYAKSKIDSNNLSFYNAGIKYAFFNGLKTNIVENNVELSALVGTFIKSEQIKIPTKLSITTHNLNNKDYAGGIFSIKPNITTIQGNFKITLGAGMSAAADTFASFVFYPVADIQYYIANSTLVLYAGSDGGINKISHDRLSNNNPYIGYNTPIDYSYEKWQLYAGTKIKLWHGFSCRLNATYKKIENMPFFTIDTCLAITPDGIVNNTTSTYNIFTAILDTAMVLQTSAEFAFSHKNLNILLKGTYFNYQLENSAYPFHKPDYEVRTTVKYAFKEKLFIKGDVFVLGRQYVKYLNATKHQGLLINSRLKEIIDGSIGIEYAYSSQLSAYIQANNVASMQYYRWNNYQAYRFSILGGISFCF